MGRVMGSNRASIEAEHILWQLERLQWLNTLADLSKMQIQFPAGIFCFAKIQFQESNTPSGLLGHEVCHCTQKYRQANQLYT